MTPVRRRIASVYTEMFATYPGAMSSDSVVCVGAGDADVARIAALIGDRARARVLMALADGRALPASVLAAEAGVAASTISEHLAQLLAAKLLTAERQGRARYFRLADPSVAEALEAIARASTNKSTIRISSINTVTGPSGTVHSLCWIPKTM